jgi:hypothetical protein
MPGNPPERREWALKRRCAAYPASTDDGTPASFRESANRATTRLAVRRHSLRASPDENLATEATLARGAQAGMGASARVGPRFRCALPPDSWRAPVSGPDRHAGLRVGARPGGIGGGWSHPTRTPTPRGSRGRLLAAHAPRSQRGARTRAEGQTTQASAPFVVLRPNAWSQRRTVRPAPTEAVGAVASCATAGGSREEWPSGRRRFGGSTGTTRAVDYS